MSPIEVDHLKHDDKELNSLMGRFTDDVPKEIKSVFSGMTRYNPNNRASLSGVREAMNISDDQYAEAKAKFEMNAKELPRDIMDFKV